MRAFLEKKFSSPEPISIRRGNIKERKKMKKSTNNKLREYYSCSSFAYGFENELSVTETSGKIEGVFNFPSSHTPDMCVKYCVRNEDGHIEESREWYRPATKDVLFCLRNLWFPSLSFEERYSSPHYSTVRVSTKSGELLDGQEAEEFWAFLEEVKNPQIHIPEFGGVLSSFQIFLSPPLER